MQGRRRLVLLVLATPFLVAAVCLGILSGFAPTVSGAEVSSGVSVGGDGSTGSTSGASSARTAVGSTGSPLVGVVGDSVLDIAEHDFFGDGSQRHLTDALQATGIAAEVSTHPGNPIRQLTPFAVDLRNRGADTIVIEGGHNDVRLVSEQGGDTAMLAQVKADFVRLLDALRDVRCVVVATPRTATSTWDLGTIGPGLVAFYRAEAAKHPNVHLADWTSLADAHAGWFMDDGVHPNAEGAPELRQFLVATVHTVC